MGEVEIKIGGFVEQKRLNTMQHINSDIAEVVQDNNDLEYLQKVYEKLQIGRASCRERVCKQV